MSEKMSKKQIALGAIVAFGILSTFVFSLLLFRHGPKLEGIAYHDRWMIPSKASDELKGMQNVSHTCEHLKEDMDKIAKNIKGLQKIADTCENLKKDIDKDSEEFKKSFPKAHALVSEIALEFKNLEPCEFDNVEQLKSMYSFNLQNNGGEICEDIRIIFENAKYIEYEIEGDGKKSTQEQSAKIGDLLPTQNLKIIVWAHSTVSNQPIYKIISKKRVANLKIN